MALHTTTTINQTKIDDLMGSKMRNLAVRTATGVVLAIVMLGAVWHSQWSFGLFLLAITLGGVREFYNMSQAKGVEVQFYSGYVAAATIFAIGFDYFYNNSALNIPLILLLITVVPTIFIIELFKSTDRPLTNIAATILGFTYVAVPLAMLAGVPLMISGGAWNPWVMILYIVIIWSNDSFAYLVGVTCGRHKLNEKISPKKSWEGFYGGVVGAILLSALVAYLFDGQYVKWVGIGFITSIVGCLGDLIESMFKRTCGVKDSGSLLPGHGGWLDRFDGFIFSAPYVMVYLMLVNLWGLS